MGILLGHAIAETVEIMYVSRKDFGPDRESLGPVGGLNA